MSEVERLVASVVHFLGEQLRSDQLSTDAKESLEVAIQCLESAYGISTSDAHLMTSKTLVEIFKEGIKGEPLPNLPDGPPSEEAKLEAERLKTEGNNLMKLEKFEDALKCYTRAIQMDGKNAVFYCNRAAAYSKLNNHSFALEDCQRAIEIDSSYSKAYGRMGLAYASLNDHFRAKDCYKKAVELDPQNESYRNNLRIAEEKVAELERQDPMGALGGSFDFGSILSNPALMNMATQLMQDPNMQNLIGGIMQGGVPGTGVPPTPPSSAGPQAPPTTTSAPPSSAPTAEPGQGSGFEAFLRAGQQLAAQMQAANPELVEQLRRSMGPTGEPENKDNNS